MFAWIAGFIEDAGYLAIAALMFAENLFPPLPSELIMPLAGFAAARGGLDIALVVLSGTAGSVAGVTVWYALALKLGRERLKRWAGRHGRWLTLSPEEVDRAMAWFERYGAATVFAGRLVPGIRTLISLPAGFAAMPVRRFLLYTTLGTACWSGMLAFAGYFLGERYAAVAKILDPATNLVLAGLAVWYVVRVATYARRGTSR